MKDRAPALCPLNSAEHAVTLLDYAAERLPEPVRRHVAAHVATCPACRRFVTRQRALWHALDEFEPEAISRSFDRRVEGAARRRARPVWPVALSRLFSGISWKPAIPAAAVLALWMVASPPVPQPVIHPEEPLNAEQVERTLEDLDMLQQIRLNQ